MEEKINSKRLAITIGLVILTGIVASGSAWWATNQNIKTVSDKVQEKKETKTYSNDDYSVRFEYPSSLSVNEEIVEDKYFEAAFSKDEESYYSLRVEKTKYTEVEQYLKEYKKSLKPTVYEGIKIEPIFIGYFIDEINGTRVLYMETENIPYGGVRAAVIKNGNLFTFSSSRNTETLSPDGVGLDNALGAIEARKRKSQKETDFYQLLQTIEIK